MIEIVLWDIDGTLLDFLRAEKAALRATFAEFGLGPCDDARIARYSAINDGYWKRLERGEITKEEALPGRFAEFFRREGLVCRDADGFNRSYQLHLADTICFLDEGDALVRDLRGHVKQYAVTNGTAVAQRRKLERSGLSALLDGAFISDEIGAEKPSARFFDHVLRSIPPVPRDRILIVGDSLTSDMAGGANAGLRCCWYNPKGLPRPEGLAAELEIRDLNELRPLLLGTS